MINNKLILDNFYSSECYFEDAECYFYLKEYITKNWVKLSSRNIENTFGDYYQFPSMKLELIADMKENWEYFREIFNRFYSKLQNTSYKVKVEENLEEDDKYPILEFFRDDNSNFKVMYFYLNGEFIKTLYKGNSKYLSLKDTKVVDQKILDDLYNEMEVLMEPYLDENYNTYLENVNKPFLKELEHIYQELNNHEYFIRYKPNTNNIIQISCDDINYFKEFEVLEDSDVFMEFFVELFNFEYEIKTKQELLKFINNFKFINKRNERFETFFVDLYNTDFNSIKFEIEDITNEDDDWY